MSPDKKRFWMWFCVGSITAIIALVWFASIRYSIGASIIEAKQSNQKSMDALTNFSDNFKKQFDEISNSLNTTTSTVATSTTK